MASFAVLASGYGSNFEALVQSLRGRHDCVMLIHDRHQAAAALRASRLGIPSTYVGYAGRAPDEAEAEILSILDRAGADLVALAGFMRLLSPGFVARQRDRILNVHPSLLPLWPGAHAIERAHEAGERRYGATVHLVDEGMDTGKILAQESFEAAPGEPLDQIEARVHAIEHRLYPAVALSLLDDVESARRNA